MLALTLRRRKGAGLTFAFNAGAAYRREFELRVFLWLRGYEGYKARYALRGKTIEAEMEYEFTLNYKIDGNVDAALERLGAAGCTDALVGIGSPGQLCLKFRRAAESEAAAIESARADVARALPVAVLIER
jgi:hypothetical protein